VLDAECIDRWGMSFLNFLGHGKQIKGLFFEVKLETFKATQNEDE